MDSSTDDFETLLNLKESKGKNSLHLEERYDPEGLDGVSGVVIRVDGGLV